MNVYSQLRRVIVEENNIYKAKELFPNLDPIEIHGQEVEDQEIDTKKPKTKPDPRYYDVEKSRLKFKELCDRDKGTSTITTKHSIYCALYELEKKLDQTLSDRLGYNIDKIYNFLRGDKVYDNRVKFHALMKVILEYSDVVTTTNIIVDFIEGTDTPSEALKALEKLRKTRYVSKSGLEDFLREVKFLGHLEYEKSFHGEHFEDHRTSLQLNYTDKVYSLFKDYITKIDNDELTVKEVANKMFTMLMKVDLENLVKSDLRCVKDVYDDEGNVIIKKGTFVEVKKMDTGLDSYLSEFMSIYKNSDTPSDAKKPGFLSKYNQIVSEIYLLISTSHVGQTVLDNIHNNMSGIFYDDKTFVKMGDIKLYWSNKGRSSCKSDYRLSIRYRVETEKAVVYRYEGGDVMVKKIVGRIPSKKEQFCSIPPEEKKTLKRETYSFNHINGLLLEGRKEDARRRYPKHSKEVFDFFANGDPSGNQKYLSWLLKNTNPDYEKPFELHEITLNYVKFFHEYNQMFQNKDINSYDVVELEKVVSQVKEKVEINRLKREAKEQKTVIHNDDRWFVVSPHSWKASCYYGAGTKWCISMREVSGYWSKYSKNSTFFFVIDKTKTKDDNFYKIAFRRIGRKGKYELWDAKDNEVTNHPLGRGWLERLPHEIKIKIDEYHKQKYQGSLGIPEWIKDDLRAQALYNLKDDFDIEYVNDSWHGMPVYWVSGTYYVVGNESEMDEGAYEYYNNTYTDSELVEYFPHIVDTHLELTDYNGFINDEVEYFNEEILGNDTKLLEYLNDESYLEQWQKYEDEINNLKRILQTVKDDAQVEKVKNKLDLLIRKQQKYLNDLREEELKRVREGWEDCIDNGIVDCFINEHGWFGNVNELFNSGLVSLDYEGVIRQLVYSEDYDYNVGGGYGVESSEDDEGGFWYLFEIDYD